MKILVVGSGGREDALCWRLGSPEEADPARQLLCAPGSAGISRHARCVDVGTDDLEGQVALALREQVDLVLIGPEAPLAAGLADRLRAQGLRVLGPCAAAARLESSKAFAKEIMSAACVPTDPWGSFDALPPALAFASELNYRVAVKADGLAAGKGVILCPNGSRDEVEVALRALLEEGLVGAAGAQVVVEELLEGTEASAIALCDGHDVLMMAGSQDHKAVFDGDRGPNTGGMGAISPAPGLSDAVLEQLRVELMVPVVRALEARGSPLRGVLYAGLMLSETGPKVLEFNVRFGDPETQALMMRIRGPLAPALAAAASGALGETTLQWRKETAICVVLCAPGYPGAYPRDLEIEGLAELAPGLRAFHAGTRKEGNRWLSNGGRVLGLGALGHSLEEARTQAYAGVASIHMDGMQFRRDIGDR